MKKKFLKIAVLAVFVLFCFLPRLGSAQEKVNVYFFYGQGCPHCAKEEKFLDKLKEKNANIEIYKYEVWGNRSNAALLGKIGRELDIGIRGVPVLIVSDQAVAGYNDDSTTGAKISALIENYLERGCEDKISSILDGTEKADECGCETKGFSIDSISESIKLPFIGTVEVKDLSLPVFTVLIAAADGFNPCAMWVLLFLISLLIGLKDKKRMWALGLAFIISSAAVYFFFVFVWLKFFLILGYVHWIRLAVALAAILSGVYHIRDYWLNREGTCRVAGSEKRKKIFYKIRKITQEKIFWISLGGIVLLAAAVNLVELVCSAGFPQIFTAVLAQANLNAAERIFYILFYIFIFMLDDLLVFIVAMKTLEMKAISSKYTRWANLAGGILILIIGLLLIFKPGWMMFG